MKTIVYTPLAAKQLDALPNEGRLQIESDLENYAMTGTGDVKKLPGRDGYMLRVGRYRVIFDEDVTTVLALTVVKRDSQTYRSH